MQKLGGASEYETSKEAKTNESGEVTEKQKGAGENEANDMNQACAPVIETPNKQPPIITLDDDVAVEADDVSRGSSGEKDKISDSGTCTCSCFIHAHVHACLYS